MQFMLCRIFLCERLAKFAICVYMTYIMIKVRDISFLIFFSQREMSIACENRIIDTNSKYISKDSFMIILKTKLGMISFSNGALFFRTNSFHLMLEKYLSMVVDFLRSLYASLEFLAMLVNTVGNIS